MKEETEINEKTKLPLSFILIISGLFFGGITRVESTAYKTSRNETEIDKLQKENKSLYKVLVKINTRLSRIEGALGVKSEIQD